MLKKPSFLYFDMGKVLVSFSHEKGCQQLAELTGSTPERVREIIFEEGLEDEYESGILDDDAFYKVFCERLDTNVDCKTMERAGSDIFGANLEMLPLVGALRGTGYRMGILSNICPPHWRWVVERYAVVDLFSILAPSYELGARKPGLEIYNKAAALAGVPGEEIFFTDDLEANVEGALKAGWDAVLFTGVESLVRELRDRGLEFNY